MSGDTATGPWVISPITPNCFHRTAGEGFLAGGEFDFCFRLLVDVGIGVLKVPGEVFGRRVAADITVDTRRVYIESAVNILFDFVFGVRHESADYADFRD
jgi:hypothetical protein